VAEISARDLRRLEALEGRLDKSQDERKTLVAERRELHSAVAANARLARASEKEAADANAKLEDVLAQNAALAKRLDEITTDRERLEEAPLELRTELDSVRRELKDAHESLTNVRRELTAAQADRDGFAETAELASEQLEGKSIPPVLPAKDVAKLLDALVSEIGSGLPGLAVRDGEVRLQVAFGKAGRKSGFVLPSATSPPEVRGNLHELAIRFDRTPEAPEGR